MNIGYIFDLNNTLDAESIKIPYLGGVYYSKIEQYKELTAERIIKIRDEKMKNVKSTDGQIKHLFFFIIKNDINTLKALSKCIDEIQKDNITFANNRYTMHVVCNFVNDDGFTINDYEKNMSCLTNNSIGVYSWFLDKYDYSSDRLITEPRRAHAITRMVTILCQQPKISNSLLQMTQKTKEALPIYNLFGDSAIFFDSESRDKEVCDYYSYKNIQHLLNIPDVSIKEYTENYVLPNVNNKETLEKTIDTSVDKFLKEQSVNIEASKITEKTQSLLIKTNDDDKEYLVNENNELVFIDELAKTNGWQLVNMDMFLTDYQRKIETEQEPQEIVSENFLEELYLKKYVIHEREGFPAINNQVSRSREKHIAEFKQKVDNNLSVFLNQQGGNHDLLQAPLTQKEVKKHYTNIDCGIAFLDYLESGHSDNLVDNEVAMGDISLAQIKRNLEKEDSKRRLEYESKKEQIREDYLPQTEGEPSKLQSNFKRADDIIKQCKAEKHRWEFQLNHWFDGDAEKKMTVRTKSVIALIGGIVAALLWLLVSRYIIADLVNDIFENYWKFEWYVFGALIVIGIVVAILMLYKAHRHLKDAEEALANARLNKKLMMDKCVKDMNIVTELHYRHLLAHHGLKTIYDLIIYTKNKKEELISFRKAIFKLMIHYWVSFSIKDTTTLNDGNTIELKDDGSVVTKLFGTEDNRRNISNCFSQNGFSMTDMFNDFRRKIIRFETTRETLNFTSQDCNPSELHKLDAEVIPCMEEHENDGLEYTTLNENSILPNDTSVVKIDDIHQGGCGDCYFLATLAAIAQRNPEYIVGKNGMIEELGDEHKYFRVKFYNKDGERVKVDIDNRFWNKDNNPKYAQRGLQIGDTGDYNAWVMAVEKAWAKVNNNGYDGIEGARTDGKEFERKVEYSFAVTGKSAFYCFTEKVDGVKLRDMIKKHFNENKLPITLYSVSDEHPAGLTDPYIYNYHAYALRSVNEDGDNITFDIFNPHNNYSSSEEVKGKHYDGVDINFIKNNFSVVVFFGIKEADFDSFERELLQNDSDNEMTKGVEKILIDNFNRLKPSLNMPNFEELLNEENMKELLNMSDFLFNSNRIANTQGDHGGVNPLIFWEGLSNDIDGDTNNKIREFLNNHKPGNTPLQNMLMREDNKRIITLFRLSPHYVKDNFHQKP